MKITADTITDEQIREWESSVLYARDATNAQKCRAVDLATRALVRIPSMKELLVTEPTKDPRPTIAAIKRKRRRARARCAEILDEREWLKENGFLGSRSDEWENPPEVEEGAEDDD